MPKDLRKTDVTPIFKKSKKEDLENCRHVSLTLIPGKAMEQLIRETLNAKKTICNSHHGFTKA